jgi:hypothetical protein
VTDVILAELEVYQSRPIAPTRRVSLGRCDLPVSPAPGYGGLLLGGVVAAFLDRIDPELQNDLTRLTVQVEHGGRVPQPRLRHRFQTDHVGLNLCRHRLTGQDQAVRFEFDDRPGTSPAPQVLAAVYAVGRLPVEARPVVMNVIRRALRWRGDADDNLLEYLSGGAGQGGWALAGADDPVSWAIHVLGLSGAGHDRRDVQRRFRELLRMAHPDHGAAVEGAAQRIAELTEARRILLAS